MGKAGDGGRRPLHQGRQGPDRALGLPPRFLNSIVIAVSSTFLAVAMGTITAYGFSRFKMPGEDDWLFFILSTRMLPPVVVAIPMFLMYRAGRAGRHAYRPDHSLYRLQPVVLGLADEGLHRRDSQGVRGGCAGRRLHADGGVLQDRAAQATTGIAATAVFCFITAWNEYAFALMMTNRRAQTAPPYIPSQLGSGLTDWTVIAAGSLLFLLPVTLFTFLLRATCCAA